MHRILTHNRPNSLQYHSSETTQVSAKKGLIHTLVHTLFSYTPNILLIDIHTFHIKQVSFCSTTGRGWPFLGPLATVLSLVQCSVILIVYDWMTDRYISNWRRVLTCRWRGSQSAVSSRPAEQTSITKTAPTSRRSTKSPTRRSETFYRDSSS